LKADTGRRDETSKRKRNVFRRKAIKTGNLERDLRTEVDQCQGPRPPRKAVREQGMAL